MSDGHGSEGHECEGQVSERHMTGRGVGPTRGTPMAQVVVGLVGLRWPGGAAGWLGVPTPPGTRACRRA